MAAKCCWQTDEVKFDKSLLQELVASLLVAEEQRWFESGSPLDTSATSSRSRENTENASQYEAGGAPNNPGWVLLRHGKYVNRIHQYFQNLEPYRYCLSLTAKKKKLGRPDTRMKLVRDDSRSDPNPQNEESAPGYSEDQGRQLKQKDPDFELFEMVIQCSQFPVLGAPPTPSPYSPTSSSSSSARVDSPTRQRFTFSSFPTNGLDDSSYSPPPQWAYSPFHPTHGPSAAAPQLSISPEPVVHADMLRELVRKTFGISKRRSVYLEKVVKDKKQPKKLERVLVEDLLLQLTLLETNHHPFYRIQAFLDKNGYSEWLIQEKENISRLIKSFWHFSFPPVPGLPIHIIDAHKQYDTLMAKLIRHESTTKAPHAVFGDVTPTSPLSPASCRLLNEFGLRYGVGELYRRLVYLKYMADHFENEAWYIRHVTALLETVMRLVTSTPEIYVKEEFIMLLHILTKLHRQSQYSMTRIIRLFPDNTPQGAVTSLVALTALVTDAGDFLKLTFPVVFLSVREAREFIQSLDEHPFEKQLANYLKEEMEGRYERFKVIGMDELHGHCYTTTLSPRLLNILIHNIRDEVNNYRTHYKHEFDRYLDVVELAVTTHYHLLMEDVLALCHKASARSNQSQRVDLRMLSLAFRLSAVDQEYAQYISVRMQTWRAPFLEFGLSWLDAVGQHVQDLIPVFQQNDAWDVAELQVSSSDTALQSSQNAAVASTPARPRDRSPSRASITPSETSAFRAPPLQRRLSDSGLKRTRPAAIPSLMQRHRMTTSYPDVSSSLPTKPRKLSPGPKRPGYGSDTNLARYQAHDYRQEGRRVHASRKSSDGSSKDSNKTENIEDIRITPPSQDGSDGKRSSCDDELERYDGALDVTRRIEAIDRSDDFSEAHGSGGSSLARAYATAKVNSDRATPYENVGDSSPTLQGGDSDSSSDSMIKAGEKWPSKRTLKGTPPSQFEDSKAPFRSDIGTKREDRVLSSSKDDTRGTVRAACNYIETGAKTSPPSNTRHQCEKCPVSKDGTCEIEQIAHVTRTVPSEASPRGVIVRRPCPIGKDGTCPRGGSEQTADPPRMFTNRKDTGSRGLVQPRALRPETKPQTSAHKVETDAASSAGSVRTEYNSCVSQSTAGSYATAQDQVSDISDSTAGNSSGKGYESSLSSEGSTTNGARTRDRTLDRDQDNNGDGKSRLILMSSSVVDLLCCIHRLTAFTCHLSKILCPTECSSSNGTASDPVYVRERAYETKTILCRKLIQVMVSLVQLYADNIISLETCGMANAEMNALLGETLRTRLEDEYEAGRLVGCRHVTDPKQRCNTTTTLGKVIPPCQVIRRVKNSSGGCEPVTQQMGVRISDVIVLRSVLLWLHGRVTSSLSCSTTSHVDPECAIKSETYCQYGPTLDGQKDGVRPLGDQETVLECVGELERCEIAQTKLVAYRANEYFRQMLHTLMGLSLPSYDLRKRVQPATEFLTRRLTAFYRVLYPDSFDKLLKYLWGHVAQDFGEEAGYLKAMRSRATDHSKLLLQTIALLMQFFHGQEQGLSLDAISKTTEEVSKHLELYASPTSRLIRMYRWFARQMLQMERTQQTEEYYSSVSSGSHQSRLHEPADSLIQSLRLELHATRKCFSGAQFVDWVLDYVKVHGYDSMGVCIGSSDTETGIELGHYLLERNLLVCVCNRQGRHLVAASREDLTSSVDPGEVSMSLEDRGKGSVLMCGMQQRQGAMSVNEICVAKRTRSSTSPTGSSRPSSSRSTSRAANVSIEESMEDDRGLTDTVEQIIYRSRSQSDVMEFYNSPLVFYSFMSDEEGNGGEFKYKLDFLDRFTVGRKLEQILCVLYTRKDVDIEAKIFLKRIPTITITEALGYERTPSCFRL